MSSARRRKGAEESNYVKYLKYKQSGFNVAASDKTMVWWPAPKESDVAYNYAEVLKDDGKKFTVRTEGGEEKTQDKNEKTFMGVNPPKFDGVEDMAELGYLNEPAVLYNLKKRYDADLFHTYSGLFLVVINPYKRLPVYTKEIVDLYSGRPRDKVAPHIFALSDGAYRAMLQTSTNQSMLITGESGAGKTENTKKVIQYLTAIAGSAGTGGSILEQQLLEFNPILEAFGNAKTTKNNNSSRFGKFIELQFNHGGQIAGAHTFIYLLEKSRVVFQAKEERNFHVFYQILSSAMPADMKAKLHLTAPKDYNFLNQSGCTTVKSIDDAQEFDHSNKALDILSVSAEERYSIWQVLSAILWLGNLPFTQGAREVAALAGPKELETAASLLGVQPAKLQAALLSPRIKAGNEWVTKALNQAKASASRDALCKALYGRLFLWVVKKINQALSHPTKKAYFIGVLDISGFEIFEKNSFEQLCINYTNEKLQQFFNHHMFTLEQQEYEKEKIDWNFVDFGMDSQDCIDLIEKKPIGILPLLDEQTVFPDADDTSFTKKLHEFHDSHRNFRTPRFQANTFKVIHYAGVVEYSTEEWLEKNRDPLEDDLSLCLKESTSLFVRDLFDESLVPSFKPAQEEASTGRSASSGRRGKGGAQFITVANQYQEQLTHLMTTLRSTSPHFIRCILPNLEQRTGYISDKVVLEQLRCNGVLEGIRISRKGWPNRTKYADFLKRYYLLKPGMNSRASDAKEAVKELMDYLVKTHAQKIKQEEFRFGVTKIFFRTGQLAQIEELREKLISSMIVSVQAGARAFLARRAYQKIAEQTTSAILLQRNIRTWLELRDWPWFQLFTKAAPLIGKRNFQKELEELKKKCKELEKQVEELRAEKEKLLKDLNEAEEDADALQAELDKLKLHLAEVEGLKADLEEDKKLLEGRVHTLEEEIKDETAAFDDLMKQKKKLEEDKRNLESTLEQKEARLNELDTAKKRLESERDDFLQKYEDEKTGKDSANDTLSRLNRQLNDAMADLDSERSKNASLEKAVKNLKNEVKDRQEELEDEQAAKTNMDKAKKALEAKVEDLEEKLDKLEAAKNDLTNKLKHQKAEADDLKASLEEAENNISRLQKEKKNIEDDLAEVEADLETERENARQAKKKMQQQITELTQALEEAPKGTANEEDIKKLEDQINLLREELLAAEEAKADAERKAKTAATEAEEAKNAAEDSERNVAKLEREIQKLKTDLEATKDSLEAEEDARAVLTTANRRLQQELDELRKKSSREGSASEQINEMRQNHARDKQLLKGEIDELTRRNRLAERDVRDLKGKLDDLRAQLDTEREAKRKFADSTRELKKLLLEREQQNAKVIGDLSSQGDSERTILEEEIAELKSKNESLSDKILKLQDEFEDLFDQLNANKKETGSAAPPLDE
ncbi:Myosin-2 heavy chain, non muscle [Balamuthia mandrillaris]